MSRDTAPPQRHCRTQSTVMIMSEQKPFCTRPPLAHFGSGPAAGMLYETTTSPPAVADPRPVTTYGLHSPQGGYQPPNSTFVMAPGPPHLLQFGKLSTAIITRAHCVLIRLHNKRLC